MGYLRDCHLVLVTCLWCMASTIPALSQDDVAQFYKGKQVRDNIHARDVARFAHAFISQPRAGETYNLGGGRQNSCSILEAFALAEEVSGKKMLYDYVDRNRAGDHICYISNLDKMRSHYPDWDLTKSLKDIFVEIHASWATRVG